MRSYTKNYITKDYRTMVAHIPPGVDKNDYIKICVFRRDDPATVAVNFNWFSFCETWIGYDIDNNPVRFGTGIELANRDHVWDFYANHPLN